MKPFHHHLRLFPVIDKMKKSKTLNKNPPTKSHKKRRPTQEPNSNTSSFPRHSCVSSHSNAAAPPGFFVQPAALETPKKVKVEDGLSSEKGKRVIAEQSSPPSPVSQSQAVKSAGVVTHTRKSLFTDADEIMILQGLIDYAKSKNVSLPLANLSEFYPFMRGKLSADVTNSQLYDKIRRLKNRYFNRLNKKSGVPVFSKNHDLQVDMLCKSIWADVVGSVVDGDDAHAPDEMEGGMIKRLFLLNIPS